MGAEVTSILHFRPRRTTWTAVAAGLIVLILLVTLVLCLSNFNLVKYALAGVLLGAMIWRWPLKVRFVIGVALVIVLINACSSSQTPQYTWDATYSAQISIDHSGGTWVVNEELTVPAVALRQITESSGQYAETLPSPGPHQYQQDIQQLTQMLKPEGLVFTGVQNGTDPVYSFPTQILTHSIPLVPFVTTQTVQLPYVVLPDSVSIVPGDDSSVIITAPSAMIAATTPGSEPETTTTGTERIINAGSFGSDNDGSASVSISTLSVAARAAPLSFLASLSVANGIPWTLGAIWALLVALAQAAAKNSATAAWKRIHPDKPDPKATKNAGKSDRADTGNEV